MAKADFNIPGCERRPEAIWKLVCTASLFIFGAIQASASLANGGILAWLPRPLEVRPLGGVELWLCLLTGPSVIFLPFAIHLVGRFAFIAMVLPLAAQWYLIWRAGACVLRRLGGAWLTTILMLLLPLHLLFAVLAVIVLDMLKRVI